MKTKSRSRGTRRQNLSEISGGHAFCFVTISVSIYFWLERGYFVVSDWPEELQIFGRACYTEAHVISKLKNLRAMEASLTRKPPGHGARDGGPVPQHHFPFFLVPGRS